MNPTRRPDQFAGLLKYFAVGDGEKRVLDIERSAVLKMGKKIVAAERLEAGRTIAVEDLAFKSPGDGLPPYEIDRVVGRRLLRPLAADEALSLEDLADS